MPQQLPAQPRRATIYIGLIAAAGLAIVLHGVAIWDRQEWIRYLAYCAISLIASGMKVSLGGVTGTMSMSFVFVLIGLSELGLPRTLVMGCLGMLMQCIFHARIRPKPVQVIFSVASMACSIQVAYAVLRLVSHDLAVEAPVRLLLASAAFFVTNTLSVAGVIALTEGKQVLTVWREAYFWTFPNYLAGAAVAWGVDAVSHQFGWQTSFLVLPVLYVIY